MIQFESIFKNELSEFLLLREVSLSKSAFDHDCHYLKKFDDYLVRCGCCIKELVEDTVIGWICSLTGKSSSIANEVIVIRIFLSRLNSIGIQAYIPPVPKVADDYVPYIFSDMEVDRIFLLADSITITKNQPNPYIQLEYPMALRLMYGCGLRIGETLALRMRDVDLDNGVLTLRHTKGNKQRLVPMHMSLISILKSYCMAMGLIGKIDSFLFPSSDSDTPMSTKTAFHRFKNILKLSDISLPGRRKHQRGPCLHCLRHAFAFKSFAKAEKDGRGINDSVPYLSIYLGHNSLKETEKYLKFSSEMYPEAMELFDDYTAEIFPEVDYEE
jgi:integrase/recombinase XerD